MTSCVVLCNKVGALKHRLSFWKSCIVQTTSYTMCKFQLMLALNETEKCIRNDIILRDVKKFDTKKDKS